MVVRMSKEYQQYATALEKGLESIYEVARKAREKGLDPAISPEPEVAKDLAELVEGLVGPPGVAESIRDLGKKLPREELAFKIAEQIIYGKFGHMDAREAAEQAIRTALAILTEGITAAPLQGVARVAIKFNPDRTRYLAIYYAGPIRSAGGTEQALTLVIGDFVRRLLGLDRYKPTEEEIRRFIEEVRLFERAVARFQYRVSDEELRRTLESIPVEVTGTESDPIEVSSFRNLPRIETNRVRGGALRVVNDGVVGRSAKVWTIVEKLGIEGWDWLKRIREIEEKRTAGFMEDIIAGRPIFSFPSRRGGFRLRYGRARNTGLAAVGIHPATMMVLQQFLAAGTQLRIEGPGKAGVVVPVDAIEPPVVRLKDGSVVRVSIQNFEKIKNVVDKILFLGDILIGFGDFLYNNKTLLPSGFTEEWWREEFRSVIKKNFNDDLEEAAAAVKIPASRLEGMLNDSFKNKPTAKEAITLALNFQVPLHPSFTFFWSSISSEDFQKLRKWLLSSKSQVEDEVVQEITGVKNEEIKGLLERICVPHKIVENKIKIENDEAYIFAFCLGLHTPKARIVRTETVFKIIRKLTGVVIREKAPTLVGARMGRPEKAKRREMRPLVHVLFPVGLAGGSRRNISEALSKVSIEVDLVKRQCPDCKTSTFKIKCPNCGAETTLEKSCPQCGRRLNQGFCPVCKVPTRSYGKQSINLKELMDEACRKLNLPIPDLVKGVKGLTNETKTVETLEKGILRAKHDLSVFKDGTIRFDATNAPLTHFKATEIGVSVERLRQLGYYYDSNGNSLTDPDQICELKVQDVVIPLKCAEYFVRVANFIDELLEKVYELPPYYEVKRVDDLVGRLVVGLAPHTSVGILGRIIGFTRLNVCYAHLLWHSAKRRDCDGDEDTLMLALDMVLNFSKDYLPAQIGGIMDAPLFIIPVVNPLEVQRQAHEVDVAAAYPSLFYEKTWEKAAPQRVSKLINLIGHRLNTEAQFQGFKYTVPVSDINMGNDESMYKRLKRMVDKLNSQLALAEKIEAVDAGTVAKKVLTTHFVRDIAGNLRAFTTQNFRCKSCNKRFRRLPLRGKCPECGGAITLTVYRGGIEKYLEAAHQLIQKYGLSDYYAQRLSLVEDEISSLFEGKKPKQISLADFIA
ncbi:MAG: DNA polymerase II large subunit [Candidatus Bathyarchaeota archaeon BA2]|nr:MAG: DNA polymerase II large subunit [Candidatus Bathyarchaeota archaeon BA2]